MSFQLIKRILKRFFRFYLKKPYNKIIFIVKSILPKTFFSRLLLIVAVIFFIVQTSIIIIFYDQHFRGINKSIIRSIASNISDIILEINSLSNEESLNNIINNINLYSPYTAEISQINYIDTLIINNIKSNTLLINEIKKLIPNKIFIIEYNKGIINQIYIETPFNNFIAFNLHQSLLVSTSLTFLISITTLFYMIAVLIAWQFFRLQVRPLRRLSRAAKSFGKIKKVKYIVPSGAIEIRETALAFNEMVAQIDRFIEQRTMMLSSVSHDLKTSLTKMKLLLELSEESSLTAELQEEVQSMTQMIASYLEFAKSDYTEISLEQVEIKSFIKALQKKHQNENFKIDVDYLQSTNVFTINVISMTRCFENLIENAKRFSSILKITIENHTNHSILISLDDNGKGIEEKDFKKVFQPFYKIDKARTPIKGSVGLGLYIVKDIITKNHGNIYLEKSKYNGLKVNIILPL